MIATPTYSIVGPWSGRLAIAPRPRGGDWLRDEMHAWRAAGFDTVVSALTEEESRSLELDEEAEASREEGLDFVSFPIEDRSVPESRAKALAELTEWESRLRNGHSIVIHCRQGIGRSALLAASLLRLAGISVESAWDEIRRARRVPTPDTTEQERWIAGIASESVRRGA